MGQQSDRYTSLRYLERFSCIGSDCEDTCCQGWQVGITQSRLTQIRKHLRPDPAELRRFDDAVELLPPKQRTQALFARMRLGEDRACVMLDADRLCSLQRRHGEAALADICRSYPRFAVESRRGLEMVASLGCPEIVRLALLAPDGTDQVTLERPADPGMRRLTIDPKLPDAALDFLLRLRGRMHELRGRGAYPLASRLYMGLELINQLKQVPLASDKAAALLDAFADPEVLQELHERFGELRPQLGLDPRPVLAAAIAAAGPAHVAEVEAPLIAFVRRVLDSYREGPEAPSPSPAALAAAYEGRRAVVLGAFGNRVEGYLRGFCRQHWFRAWDLMLKGPEGLDRCMRVEILSVAMIRFLLLGHPDAVAAAADPERGAAALDRLVVAFVYSFARIVDHRPDAREQFLQLVDRHAPDLGSALPLLAI